MTVGPCPDSSVWELEQKETRTDSAPEKAGIHRAAITVSSDLSIRGDGALGATQKAGTGIDSHRGKKNGGGGGGQGDTTRPKIDGANRRQGRGSVSTSVNLDRNKSPGHKSTAKKRAMTHQLAKAQEMSTKQNRNLKGKEAIARTKV